MRKKFTYFISSLLYTTALYSNPSPLGIELNKSTLDDVKKSYRIVAAGVKSVGKYHSSFLNVKDIQLDTLSVASVTFNEKNIVEGVDLTLDKNKFNEINQILSKKYKTVYSQNPPEGYKMIVFQDGDCTIGIHAPNAGFAMHIQYSTKALSNKIEREYDMKQQQTKNML